MSAWEGTAQQVAEGLSERVLAGVFRSGDRLREAAVAAELGVARNSAREAVRVRILHDPSEIERFAPGEVLVVPTTTPAWTPLFGIPAVVGTENGTRMLSDGQTVTVDGTTGVASW